jgi:hypothetical protein
MKKVADEIPAYTYGTAAVTTSAVSLEELKELKELKASAGFTSENKLTPEGSTGTIYWSESYWQF